MRNTQKIVFIIICGAAFAFGSGCSTVAYVPTPDFNLPETSGQQLSGRVGLGTTQPTKLTISNDTSTTPPDLSNPSIDEGPAFPSFQVSLGLLPSLDITLGGTGLRWQFLGQGTTSGWRASAFLQRGSILAKTAGGSTNSSETDTISNQLGVSAGVRKSASTLVYGTLAFSDYKVKTTITQPSLVTSLNDAGSQYHLIGGVELKSRWGFVQFEARAHHTTFSRVSDPKVTSSTGLLFGVHW